jgi:hypothetical protein
MQPRIAQRGRDWSAAVVGARKRLSAAVTVAFTLLGGVAVAAPAAAQGVIGTGSGRAGAIVAWGVALSGVIAGALALARSAGRIGIGDGRDGAIVALVMGLMGIGLAALHLATSSGGIGTGNGRAGAIVALALGLIGMVLGRLALARCRTTVQVRLKTRRETQSDV